MVLNFNKLRIFYEAAKVKSFTKAADNLFITQPAVSSQIKSLEEEMGFKLFVKFGRQCELTPMGEMLFESVKKIFEYEKEIIYMLNDIKNIKKGVLRIGAAQTYVKRILPSIILKYHSIYPNVKIIIDEGTSLDIYKNLLENKYDIIFIGNINISEEIVFLPFTKHKIVLISSPLHPISKKKSIKFEEIKNESFILKDKNSATYKTVIEVFNKHNFFPNIVIETNDFDFIKKMVIKGEALSFVLLSSVYDDIQKGYLKYIPISDEKIFLKVYIGFLNINLLSPSAKAFLKIIKKDKYIK